MEVEGSAHSYLANLLAKPQDEKILSRKSSSQDNTVATSSVNGCFDCNICLEFAIDPVVSLCGHLYCWPCIYKWLRVEGTSSQQCPVCKAHLSEETLVPLYGRGGLSRKGEPETPHRPTLLRDHAVIASGLEHQPLATQGQIHNDYHQPMQLPEPELHGLYNHSDYNGTPDNCFISSPFHTPILHWTVGSMLGDLATAILPSVFRNNHEFSLYYASPQSLLNGSSNNLRMRRQQMQVANSLHQIWVFLLVLAILCFLLF